MNSEPIFILSNKYTTKSSNNVSVIKRNTYVYTNEKKDSLFTFSFNGYPISGLEYNFLLILMKEYGLIEKYENEELNCKIHSKMELFLNQKTSIEEKIIIHKEIQSIKNSHAKTMEMKKNRCKNLIKNICKDIFIPDKDITVPGYLVLQKLNDFDILNLLRDYIIVSKGNLERHKILTICFFIKNKANLPFILPKEEENTKEEEKENPVKTKFFNLYLLSSVSEEYENHFKRRKVVDV